MNNLIMFEGNNVKIMIGENGEPMFELYSVGMALGYTKEAKGKLYPRKERIEKTLTSAEIEPVVHGGQQYLTEEMIYDFMFEAKTEKCKSFRKWLSTEILPRLRRNGGVVIEDREEEFINTHFTSFSEEVKLMMVQDLRKKNQEMRVRLKEQAPKVKAYDEFMDSDGLYSTTNVAKMLGFKRSDVFKFLRYKGFVFKNKAEATVKGITSGYFKQVVTPQGYSNMKVTPTGIEYIRNNYEEVWV